MGHKRRGQVAREIRRGIAMVSADQRRGISEQEQIFILKQRTGESARETKKLQERMEMKWELEKALKRLNAGKLN